MLKRTGLPLALAAFLLSGGMVTLADTPITAQSHENPESLSFEGAGSASGVFYAVDVVTKQNVSYNTKIDLKSGTGTHHKAFAFLIPASYLGQETDLWPINQGRTPRNHIYLHEVWNGADTFVHAQQDEVKISHSTTDEGFWVPIVFPSKDRGEVQLESGLHYLVIASTGEFRYTIELVGQLASSGPVAIEAPIQGTFSEGSFGATLGATARVNYLPAGAVVYQSEAILEINQTSFVFLQVRLESSEASFRLIRPSGEEEPLSRKWNSGSFAGGLLLTKGGLYQTDLVVQEPGTWKLIVEHSAGAAFDMVAASLPLERLKDG